MSATKQVMEEAGEMERDEDDRETWERDRLAEDEEPDTVVDEPDDEAEEQ